MQAICINSLQSFSLSAKAAVTTPTKCVNEEAGCPWNALFLTIPWQLVAVPTLRMGFPKKTNTKYIISCACLRPSLYRAANNIPQHVQFRGLMNTGLLFLFVIQMKRPTNSFTGPRITTPLR